ncbi:MAG: M20/M25/M40 family metallo-hydrolase [Coriobacteriia bacterium]|nr:M20/M25/M40 family metallo-hydrolase [Coriobacteriia bacterium]
MNSLAQYPLPDKERLLADFLALVQIDSPSYSEAGVMQWLSGVLGDAGLQLTIDNSTMHTGSQTGNLIAVLPATPGRTDRVYLSAHTDTASPGEGIMPVVTDGVITSSSDTVLGGDDKVGIAAIVETVRVLIESDQSHPEVVILFSVAEEVGLKGAKAIDGQALGFNGEPCFVLDAGGLPGGVIIGAPFHIEYTARFIGRQAHAGVSPETGISAISMAAQAIASLPTGRLDEMTTANVGTIQGGSANNVVAEECLVTGEMRSLSEDRVYEVKEKIGALMDKAASDFGGEVQAEFTLAYPGFKLAEDDALVQLVLETARELGLAPAASYTGGGSDANIYAGKGLKPLVLATGMTAVHSKDESLAVADLVNITQLLVALVLRYRA